MAELPSADEFFGASAKGPARAPLPTADEFFGAQTPRKPLEGPAQDSIWSNLASANGRILDALGQGAKDAWGARPLGLSSEAEMALKQLGVFNDYSSGHESYFKSINEALIRPVAAAADFVVRAPQAVIGGLTSAAEQAETEQLETPGLGPGPAGSKARQALAAPFGFAAEVGRNVQGGFIPEFGGLPHAPEIAAGEEAAQATQAATAADRLMDVSKARALGVVGEGEAGFYDAEPLTPENAQARAGAAADAGMTPTPPGPAPLDIHALARRVDPATFERFDALAAQRDAARDQLSRLEAEGHEGRPDVAEARRDLNDLIGLEPEVAARAGAFEERLQAIAASAPDDLLEKVATAYDRLQSALHDETPEMAAARSRLMEADFQMRELAPQVSEAYRHAAEITPEPIALPDQDRGGPQGQAAGGGGAAQGAKADARPETPEEGPGAPGASGEGARPIPPGAIQAVAAEVEQMAPPKVLGEDTLGEPTTHGASTETAEGAPKTAQARYGNLKAVEGTGEARTRSLSEGVEAKAIEDGLTRSFGDLPQYRALSMKEQAGAVTELMDRDYELAKSIAMGERQPPKGILPESVFVGVEKRALAEGDVETLRQLGTGSKLTTTATTMGQRIRTLGEREQASPVGHIQEVQQAREAELEKQLGAQGGIEKAKADTAAEIKAEVKKSVTTKADAWADFVATIRCEG